MTTTQIPATTKVRANALTPGMVFADPGTHETTSLGERLDTPVIVERGNESWYERIPDPHPSLNCHTAAKAKAALRRGETAEVVTATVIAHQKYGIKGYEVEIVLADGRTVHASSNQSFHVIEEQS